MFTFFRPRRSIWGWLPQDLEVRFEGEELSELLHPGHGTTRVVLRPCVGRDHHSVERVRRSNVEWLGQWEASIPPESGSQVPTWEEFPALMDRRQEDGEALSMMVEVDGEIAGLVSVGAIERGAMQLGVLGYWIAQKWAGRGITSLAVAAVIDLVLKDLGLHRVEVNVRPENVPSLGLARKLQLREEGYKPRFMHINGRWADHVGFAIDQDDLKGMAGHSLVTARIRREGT